MAIKAGRIAPSTILRKLGTASRKNKLYYAFRELGRVVRTCFLNGKSMTEALKEMQDDGMALTPDILRALSPYRQHPSRFGMYELRDSEVGPIDYDVWL
jgi:hypothetical protein